LWRQTPFRFESSRARDGRMWWIILHRGGTIFGRRGVGNDFSMSHTATSSWPYMDFKFFCDVSSGGGVMPLCGKWVCLWPYMGTPQRRRFLGWLKCVTPYYWGTWLTSAYAMVFLCVQWFEVRGSCSFCWYWWICWSAHHCLNFLFTLIRQRVTLGSHCVSGWSSSHCCVCPKPGVWFQLE